MLCAHTRGKRANYLPIGLLLWCFSLNFLLVSVLRCIIYCFLWREKEEVLCEFYLELCVLFGVNVLVSVIDPE